MKFVQDLSEMFCCFRVCCVCLLQSFDMGGGELDGVSGCCFIFSNIFSHNYVLYKRLGRDSVDIVW